MVRGRTVLDFASGSGLVAIAAARAGAAAVTASEIDPLAVAAIELNCAANHVHLAAILGDLLGTGPAVGPVPGGPVPGGPVPDNAAASNPPAADVILAGDVFYERTMAERLLPWLTRARQSGALVLVGDPGRAYLPRDRFDQVAAYEVRVSRAIEDSDIKHTTVCRLR